MKLYDLSLLEAMGKNDASFIVDILRMFLESIPEDLNQLNKTFVDNDWNQFGKAAHKLKATIDTLGVQSISDTIRQIETSCKSDVIAKQDLQVDVNKVTSVLEQVYSELNEKYSKGN